MWRRRKWLLSWGKFKEVSLCAAREWKGGVDGLGIILSDIILFFFDSFFYSIFAFTLPVRYFWVVTNHNKYRYRYRYHLHERNIQGPR